MTVQRDSYRHRMKQNDLEPSVRRRLVSKETGNPISLVGATAKFLMANSYGTLKVNAAAVIESPATAGIVRYDWTSGDTSEAGTFEAEFQITFPGGRNYSMPNDGYIVVEMLEELGS